MGLDIGDCVDVGHQVNIFTMQHDIDDPDYRAVGGPVRIENHAVIGGRATILPNLAVGQGAVVATGAVVTKDVGSFQMVGGVPAKFIRERNPDIAYKISYRAWFQ
jgi:maltose O-acetyltransferase